MLIVVRAWIFPDADTIDSRSRFLIFSTWTSTPFSRLK